MTTITKRDTIKTTDGTEHSLAEVRCERDHSGQHTLARGSSAHAECRGCGQLFMSSDIAARIERRARELATGK
jgi:hypothetical protein